MTIVPLKSLPRRCPLCGHVTMIGHGQRRRRAHDDQHDIIWVRRPEMTMRYTEVGFD